MAGSGQLLNGHLLLPQPLPEALFHPSELSLNVSAHESVPLHRPCACLPPLCSPLSVVFDALLGPVLLSVPPQVVKFVRAGTFSRSPLYPPCLASWRRKVNPGNESISSSREGFPRASLGRWRSRPWEREDAHVLPPGFGGLLCSCSGWGLSPSWPLPPELPGFLSGLPGALRSVWRLLRLRSPCLLRLTLCRVAFPICCLPGWHPPSGLGALLSLGKMYPPQPALLTASGSPRPGDSVAPLPSLKSTPLSAPAPPPPTGIWPCCLH